VPAEKKKEEKMNRSTGRKEKDKIIENLLKSASLAVQ
jgi:hypothetical protein